MCKVDRGQSGEWETGVSDALFYGNTNQTDVSSVKKPKYNLAFSHNTKTLKNRMKDN